MISAKKIIGQSPATVFEAIDAMNLAHQKLISACFILQSYLDNPEHLELNNQRAINFLKDFTDETDSTR